MPSSPSLLGGTIATKRTKTRDTWAVTHTHTHAAFSLTVTGCQVGPVSWPASLLISPLFPKGGKHTHTHTYTRALVFSICSLSLSFFLSLINSRFLNPPTPHSLWFYVTPTHLLFLLSSFLSQQGKGYDYLAALNFSISHSCSIHTPFHSSPPPFCLPPLCSF